MNLIGEFPFCYNGDSLSDRLCHEIEMQKIKSFRSIMLH